MTDWLTGKKKVEKAESKVSQITEIPTALPDIVRNVQQSDPSIREKHVRLAVWNMVNEGKLIINSAFQFLPPKKSLVKADLIVDLIEQSA